MDFYQNCIWFIFYKLEIYLGLILIYNISINNLIINLLYSHLWIWPVCEDSMFPFLIYGILIKQQYSMKNYFYEMLFGTFHGSIW